MNDLENKIRNIVKKILLPKQNIIDVVGDINSGYIRIVIDGEKNISLKETTNLTKKLKQSLEFEALLPKGYRLEVTSPGLDSPLKYPFQYKKNIGRKINVSYIENHENINSLAKIIDAGDECVYLKINKANIALDYKKINIAKVKITFN